MLTVNLRLERVIHHRGDAIKDQILKLRVIKGVIVPLVHGVVLPPLPFQRRRLPMLILHETSWKPFFGFGRPYLVLVSAD